MTETYDQRVRLTKALIRKAFLKLLAGRKVSRITVRALCEEAGINRGTFYKHYLDVYDLKEQIENELLNEFGELVARTLSTADRTSDRQVYNALYTIFSLLKENSDLCRILLGDGGSSVVDKFSATGESLFLRYYRESLPQTPVERLETYYLFVSTGCIAILRRWILSGTETPLDTLCLDVAEIMTTGARFLEP